MSNGPSDSARSTPSPKNNVPPEPAPLGRNPNPLPAGPKPTQNIDNPEDQSKEKVRGLFRASTPINSHWLGCPRERIRCEGEG